MLLSQDGAQLRARLDATRLMLLFTPDLADDPWQALGSALPHVDAVQVRPKPLGDADPGAELCVSEARASVELARKVLELCVPLGEQAPLVFVNDRVDVARLLRPAGLAGVHLGQDDCPGYVAREVLGPEALIGRSTHDAVQAVEAADEVTDYLGFGPIYATPTKGYGKGLGPDRAWVVSDTLEIPVFPIGGIDLLRAPDLKRVGRAAVGSAILGAADPGVAARMLRESLLQQ